MSYRFLFTKGTAMCKLVTVKEREKNAKKLTIKNVLNDQKYHEILQILQGEIFKLITFCNKTVIFILIGKRPNSS